MVGQLITIESAVGQQRDVALGRRGCACTTLVRGPRKPVRSSSSIGVQPCSACALVQLAPLLAGVDVADEAVRVGVGARSPRSSRRGRRARCARRRRRSPRRGRPPTPAARRRAPGTSPRRGRRSARWPAIGAGRRRASRRGGRRPASSTISSPQADRGLGQRDRHRVGLRRRACRRAGGGRSGTRRPSRSRRPPSAVDARADRRASSRGRGSTASRYISVRQLQKSSAVRCRRGRSPAPRRSIWNAWLCALAIAGTVAAAHRWLVSLQPRRRRARTRARRR